MPPPAGVKYSYEELLVRHLPLKRQILWVLMGIGRLCPLPGWTSPLLQQMPLGYGQQGKDDTGLTSWERACGGLQGQLRQCVLAPALWPALPLC